MSKLIDYFKETYANDKLVQSFLIGNISFEEIYDDMNYILSNYIFEKKVFLENNPDIYILRNKDKNISKSDIKDLINKLSITSQFNNKKVYIIEDFELLNLNSNNALLKILEEPKPGIYAFLITKNIDAILPTILSRCQKIFINSSVEKVIDYENIKIANELIKYIETDNVKTIAKNVEIYSIINDRNQLNDILTEMFNVYNKALMSILNNNNICDIITDNNDIKKISKKLIVINNNINRLSSNTNKNLSIDRLIIEMWRCNR